VRRYVIGYPVKDGKVLLIYKKRGLGEGLYNGVGGKVEDGESPEEAIVREAEEEIGIKVMEFRRVADKMWEDDRVWLWRVLRGERLTAKFWFNDIWGKYETPRMLKCEVSAGIAE